jgi:hypothetical protein
LIEGLDYEFTMVLAPLKDGSVVAGTSGGGAFRLSPSQSVWNPSSRGLPPASAIRVMKTGRWLLAGTVGLRKSSDAGASWRHAGLTGKNVTALAVVSPTTSDTRASSNSGGLLVQRANRGAIPVVVGNNGLVEIIAGTARGELFWSHDTGATWERVSGPEPTHNGTIRALTLSGAANKQRIGVVVERRGFFISEDGHRWQDASATLGPAINLVVGSPHNDRILFAMTADRGVFRSLDVGATWTPCQGLPPDEIFTGMAELKNDDNVVFIASLDRAVYRSDDGGQRFGRVGRVAPPVVGGPKRLRWTAIAAYAGGGSEAILVVGSSLGAYLSDNGGRTWAELPAGVLGNTYTVNDLIVLDDGTVVMATRQGVFSRQLASL